MSLFSNNALIGASAAGDYEIERSLRFNDGDSPYLARTPGSAGNQKTWTYSCWFKLCGNFGGNRGAFLKAGADSNNYFKINIASDDKLYVLETISGAYKEYYKSDNVFRDPTSWMHLVLRVDTTNSTDSEKVRVYLNGIEQSGTRTHNPTASQDLYVNGTTQHEIGASTVNSQYFDGYIADPILVDGSTLAPSSFAETHEDTGQWVPKRFSGSYGTDGFYLKFSDNSGTTATTLGKDSSGNGNNFTPNNFSVTAGTANDSLTDTPNNNYCVLTNVNCGPNIDIIEGGLKQTYASAGNYHQSAVGSFGVNSGKWYWEIEKIGTFGDSEAYGITREDCRTTLNDGNMRTGVSSGVLEGNYYGYECRGYKGTANPSATGADSDGWITSPVYGASWLTSGDVIGIALDFSAGGTSGKITFYKNGTSQGIAYSDIDCSYFWLPNISMYGDPLGNAQAWANFGQRPFKYTVPADHQSLCTANLAEPTIVKSNTFFDVVGWTGTGSSKAITDLAFQPTKVVIKNRGADGNYGNYASDRGVQKELHWDTTDAEATEANGLTAFGANGFTVGSDNTVNQSGNAMIAYCWKKSTTAGFNSGTYAGNDTAGRTIAHGLGVAPQVVIVKITDGSNDNWNVYSADIGAGRTAWIDTTSVVPCGDSNYYGYMWNSTAPTATNFTLGSNGAVNGASSRDYVWHAFSQVNGFSKFGKYKGTGNVDGPFIYCGFRPAFFLFKCTTETRNWLLLDDVRPGYNTDAPIYFSPDDGSDDNGNSGSPIDFLADGIKIQTDSIIRNKSGETYFYMAFAQSPLKYANAR